MNKELILLQRSNNISTVRTKDIAAYPLPKFYELRLLLDQFPEFSAYKVGFAIIAIWGLRPCECAELSKDCFLYNEDKTKIIGIQYYSYKARNNKNKFATYKMITKKIHSAWLSNQIMGYLSLNECLNGKIFTFSEPDSFNKEISKLRKDGKYLFFKEKITETLKGQDKTQYRISPYSFRRFAFTFHYWITYKQEAVKLSKEWGHSKVDTTMSYYVFPKEAIGLTDRDLEDPLNIDDYLGFTDKYTKFFEEHTVQSLVNENLNDAIV